MMTESDVRTLFAPYIEAAERDGIPERIKIYPGQYVDVGTFCTLFADCELTYASLSEKDGGLMGYVGFFDQAKAEGHLK